MKLILMIDEKSGMAFNKRRLTRDIVQREFLNRLLAGKTLWMSPYSAKLFLPDLPSAEVKVDSAFLSLAEEEDYVLLELDPVPENTEEISEILLFNWNRSYPADLVFFLPKGFVLTEEKEFKGSSHDRITMEVYRKDEKV